MKIFVHDKYLQNLLIPTINAASEVETAESDQKDRPDSASTLVSDNKKSPITPETTSQAANQQILPPPSPLLNPLKGTPKLGIL